MKKRIKRAALISSLTFCFGLLSATSWLLVNPITAKAAECSANCGIAPPVSCSGSGECYAQDGWGCRASNGQGRAPMIQLCQVF